MIDTLRGSSPVDSSNWSGTAVLCAVVDGRISSHSTSMHRLSIVTLVEALDTLHDKGQCTHLLINPVQTCSNTPVLTREERYRPFQQRVQSVPHSCVTFTGVEKDKGSLESNGVSLATTTTYCARLMPSNAAAPLWTRESERLGNTHKKTRRFCSLPFKVITRRSFVVHA